MKERPILFNGAMVRAILEGRKTQTRRVMKPQPTQYRGAEHGFYWEHKTGPICCASGDRPGPYAPWHVEDHLWVRETWRDSFGGGEVHYPADLDEYTVREKGPWKPSIHMPRSKSRISLEVADVRVERLQDISEEDARAEGASCYVCGQAVRTSNEADCACFHGENARASFDVLWDSINGARPGCSWDANPWVWVVGFKRVEQKAEAAE